MPPTDASLGRALLIWAGVVVAAVVPLTAAAFSPQLEWRHPVYIVAGFAGIFALALLFLQPLLIGGYLPRLSVLQRRRMHRWLGGILVAAVVIHVVALSITSLPDVIDALLFRSPTPFSVWGVIAMWATLATALLAALRRRLRLRPTTWRTWHSILVVIIVVCTVLHAVLIEGTMEAVSKLLLCVLVFAATIKVLGDFRVWFRRRERLQE